MLKSVPSTNKEDRRRGRPAGKNRVPLSKEERRARNAQYERERRNETAEVMSQLAEAALCDPQISNAELLATVINRIQRAAKRNPNEIDDLRRINDNLENQIAILLNRLGDDAHLYEKELREVDEKSEESQSESSTNSEDKPTIRPRKYRKLSKTSSIHNRKRTGKKIRVKTESSSSSSEWTETDTTSSRERETQSSSSSSDDRQQSEAEVIEETNEYYDETQVLQEITEVPNLNESVKLEQGVVDQETQLDNSIGPLTNDIRGVLSDLLNDNEIIELGLQDANELTNWPVNLEDIFAGY